MLVRIALLVAMILSFSTPVLAQNAIDEDDDPRVGAWAGAAVSTCTLAFDVYLVTRADEAFGPRALVDVSLGLSVLGAVGAHFASFALLDGRLARDPFTRALLGGLVLASTGLSLVAFALPTAWALTTDPPTGEDSVAVVMPYLLGAMGVTALAVGTWFIASARHDEDMSVALSIAPTPTSASLVLSGRF